MSFGYGPRSEIPGSHANPEVNHLRSSVVPSTAAILLLCPPAVHKGSSVSTASQTLVLICRFDDGHPRGSEVAPHCGFDSHFPEGRRNGSWKKSVRLTKTKIRRKYRERKRYPGCKHKDQSWLENWPRHRTQWAGQCSLETAFLGFGSDVDAHGGEVAVLHEKVRMYLCRSSFLHN